jgi:hypothetical protein
MKKVKEELTNSANLLLLHKGLARHLQQLQTDRHPIILKTKNVVKLQKKYENYINSVDALHDTVGKLKCNQSRSRKELDSGNNSRAFLLTFYKNFSMMRNHMQILPPTTMIA